MEPLTFHHVCAVLQTSVIAASQCATFFFSTGKKKNRLGLTILAYYLYDNFIVQFFNHIQCSSQGKLSFTLAAWPVKKKLNQYADQASCKLMA